MSAEALQRVAVRMLYDEAFAAAVYEDAPAATADCDLSDIERAWLSVPDPRAWRVDPLRRSRSLAALLEEFAVSAALFVRSSPAATGRLDSFFTSEEFHRGMQSGRSLAAMFSSWFAPQIAPAASDLLRLEAALARVRRVAEAAPPDRSVVAATIGRPLVLGPALEVLAVRSGTVSSWMSILGVLRQGAVADRAIDPGVPIPGLALADHEEGVLVDGRGGDPRLERMSAELARVLAGAAHPVGFTEFCRRAAEYGADAADCRAILESFGADGILEAVPQA